MKRIALLVGLFCGLSATAYATTCNGYTITGTCYYAATTGNDSNAGTGGSPWLSPSHSLNCGDMIVFAAGTYPEANFNASFGTVTGSGHCFAIAMCTTFDACYAIGTDGNAMFWVTKSHWWVQGFESQNPNATSSTACFKASPLSATTIADIAFVDDVANGCPQGGFITDPYYGGGQYSVDYFILIADVAFNASQSNNQCGSGVSIYLPVNYDTLVGTHNLINQYFGWGNVNPATCGGHAATDGEGVILDDYNGDQGSFATAYTGQTVIEDSITIWNGARGIEAFDNTAAPIYITRSTGFADGAGPGLNASPCADIEANANGTPDTKYVQVYANLTKTNSTNGCGANAYYAYSGAYLDGTNVFYNNVGYSSAGNNTHCGGTCTGFSFGPNNSFGTDPAFVSAPSSTPAAPSCGAYASVPACMAGLIAAMKPTAAGTANYGYQPVSNTIVYDALYPQVLCNYQTELAGLVTQGCLTASAMTGSGTGSMK